MSETTLTQDAIQAIRNRESVTVYMTRDLGSEAKTVVITPEERRALCDAAARAETLEAQLTEVTRERDAWKDAVIDAAVVNWTYTAAQETDPRAAVLALIKCIHEEATDPQISQTAFEWQQRIEKAEAALAPLRAIVEKARYVVDVQATWGECSDAMRGLQDALSALPADPSAPTPLVSVTRAQAEQRLTDALVNRIYRAIEHMNGWEDEDNGYDGAKKAIIAALFPDSAAASGQAR